MFNEIPTGNTSNDSQTPPAWSPTVPVGERQTCAQCSRQFVAKSNPPSAVCPLCFVTNLEQAQKQNHVYEAAAWNQRQRRDFVRTALGLIVGLAVALGALIMFGVIYGLAVATVALLALLPLLLRRPN